MGYKQRYWNTLIQLEDESHKDKLTKLAKKQKTSRSKLIGKLIHEVLRDN